MSKIRFKCPHCGQEFEGDGGDIGAMADCTACGQTFEISSQAAVPTAARPSGIQCYLDVFRLYFCFKRRMGRREFWWAFLFNFLAMFVVGFIDGFTNAGNNLVLLATLASSIPMLAAQSRRLHDTNKSAWWLLIIPLPVVNLAYLVWLASAGDRGPNRFGPDPNGGQ